MIDFIELFKFNNVSYFKIGLHNLGGQKCPFFNKTRKMGEYFKFLPLLSNSKSGQAYICSVDVCILLVWKIPNSDHSAVEDIV